MVVEALYYKVLQMLESHAGYNSPQIVAAYWACHPALFSQNCMSRKGSCNDCHNCSLTFLVCGGHNVQSCFPHCGAGPIQRGKDNLRCRYKTSIWFNICMEICQCTYCVLSQCGDFGDMLESLPISEPSSPSDLSSFDNQDRYGIRVMVCSLNNTGNQIDPE